MGRSFVVNMLLGAAIPLCMTLGSGVALYVALQSSLNASTQILREQAMIAAANNLKLRFVDAETGQRGYVITGSEEFLLPYEQSRSSFVLLHDRVLSMIEDQPAQRERLSEARQLFERWQAEAATVSIERRRAGLATPDMDNFERGKQLVDSFRLLMDEFTEAANLRLQEEQQASIALGHRANLIAIAGFGSALLAALVLWLLLANRTSLTVNGITQAAKRMTEGDWRTRAPELGSDELAAMARAFNLMAERLETMVGAEKEARQSLAKHVDDMVASRTKEMLAMNHLVEMLQSCHLRDEAIQVLRSVLPSVFTNASGALLLRDEEGERYTIRVAWGEQAGQVEIAVAEVDCWSLRRGKPYEVSSQVGSGVVCGHIKPQAGNHYCTPLTAHGNTLGVLHTSLPDNRHTEWESCKQLTQAVAEQVSLSLANIQLRERLQQQSVRDPLTGLYNRRYLEESIQRELTRAKRESSTLSVIMLDLDHFKRINDDYGHSAGDKVLVVVSELLRNALRGEDLVCRFGGEEFTLIMPGATLEVAAQRAEQLRCAIERLTVDLGDDTALTVTSSLGIAAYPDHGDDAQALLDLADDALYKAKHAGRNQVAIAML
ncbi:sensor domain-containing diguanylate cyclase [Vreelandella neptunia]|uniref:diguanylate cyclase n=1 Tax=Vreelandella neptunia TaxID=115551 RepID=A0ABS9SA00_9GAMM|nr:diguanylate cyclase [Halomonas neptunia]MCH4812936.1 diguanylate cyclase [Halomonas neptunia]